MAEQTLTWTSTPPTQPGWYWTNAFVNPQVVELEAYMPRVDETLLVHGVECHSWSLERFIQDYPKGQWAGPLQPPE